MNSELLLLNTQACAWDVFYGITGKIDITDPWKGLSTSSMLKFVQKAGKYLMLEEYREGNWGGAVMIVSLPKINLTSH